jgi:trigger factor
VKIDYQTSENLQAILSIELGKEDYAEKVEKELRSLQKTLAIRGFRPGKAPIEMVRRFYGKNVLADEVQRLANQALNDYLTENNIDILGYPLSSETIPSRINFETDDNFLFTFDLGLAPKFELNFSSADHLEKFEIAVDESEIDKDIEYMRRRLGKLEDVESAENEDVIYANLCELGEDGELLEGGVQDKQASVVANMVQDEALKNTLLGIKPGTKLTVNIFQLFNNNDTVIKNTLGIQQEAIADLNMNFSFEVTSIKRRTLAELGPEYYQELYGPESYPANEEEYRERVKSNLENYYANEAQLWVDHQLGHLIAENHRFELPDAFLKRWLLSTKPEEYNADNIDERYSQESSALRRQLVVEKVAEAQEIQVDENELRMSAYEYVADLYRQYGLMNAGHMVVDYAEKQLQDQDFRRRMADRVIHRKAYDAIKTMITLDPKPVSVEEYFNHINAHKHNHNEQ